MYVDDVKESCRHVDDTKKCCGRHQGVRWMTSSSYLDKFPGTTSSTVLDTKVIKVI